MIGHVARYGGTFAVAIGLLLNARPASAGSQPAPTPMQVDTLVRGLAAADGMERLQATRDLFRLGQGALASLEQAGAREMSTARSSRLDAIYSILRGLPVRDMKPNSFGIISDPAATRDDIVSMGQRDGFLLPAKASFTPDMFPTCYVQLRHGQALAAVMRRVLEDEPLIVSVTLNRVDP